MRVLAFAGLAVLLALTLAPSPQETSRSCDAHVDGAAFPFLVPPHFLWDELWQRAHNAGDTAQREQLASELGIEPLVVEQIARAAAGREAFAAARLTAQAGREFFPAARRTAQAGADPDLAAADASLDARDRLLGAIDTGSGQRIQNWVFARAARPFRLGVAGELIETPDGKRRCKASVNGAVDPELIPEWSMWHTYFVFMSDAAAFFRDSEGRYPPTFMRALQARYPGSSTGDIQRLLNLVTETIALIQSYQASPRGSPQETGRSVREAIMAARARVRSEFQGVWTSALREVNEIRGGTTFDFPPFEEKPGVNR